VHGISSWHGRDGEFAHRLHLLEDSATSLLLVSCTHRCSGQGCTETFLLRFHDTFRKALEELDARIDFGEDYGDWESDFFEMKDLCCKRYFHWLRAKGVPEPLSDQFSACLESYLTFIYQYDAGSVLDVLPNAIEEFFMDWLMRKVMVKPPEYTQWPPALRLFYRFLFEKGYLDDPEPILQGLYAIEPAFIALVKQRA
jgi:hypothetical protein